MKKREQVLRRPAQGWCGGRGGLIYDKKSMIGKEFLPPRDLSGKE